MSEHSDFCAALCHFYAVEIFAPFCVERRKTSNQLKLLVFVWYGFGKGLTRTKKSTRGGLVR